MCGLVALVNLHDDLFPVEQFMRMLREAQIRGQHATGYAYNADGMMTIVKEPIPADQMRLPKSIEGASIAIGHCRYSTSGGETHQPIANRVAALIHNGVVTQEPKEKWFDKYGVECEGDNDSEILLRYDQKDLLKHPLDIIDSSQACIKLRNDDSLTFWRNEQRPLYYIMTGRWLAIASTKDILVRSGFEAANILECKPCHIYTFWMHDKAYSLTHYERRIPQEDLQTC